MGFLDKGGVSHLINGVKQWSFKKLNAWWQLLQFSHIYGDKANWEYSFGVVENTDNNTKDEFPVVPKLWIYSNDWIYSKWSETKSENRFPLTMGPQQYENLKSGNKYQSYYTNNNDMGNDVIPSNGDIEVLNGIVKANKLAINGGTSLSVIKPDGSTILISNLGWSRYFIENDIYNDLKRDNRFKVRYTITPKDFIKLNGSGIDGNAFLVDSQNLIFERCNRDYDTSKKAWVWPNWVGNVIKDDGSGNTEIIDIKAYFVGSSTSTTPTYLYFSDIKKMDISNIYDGGALKLK